MTIFTIEIQLYGLCKMLEERFGLLNSTLESSVNVNSINSINEFHEDTNLMRKGNFFCTSSDSIVCSLASRLSVRCNFYSVLLIIMIR